MRVQVSLNQKSINHAIGELKKYKDNLYFKTGTLISKLLDEGISVAQGNAGSLGKYIMFQKDVEDKTNGFVGILIGENRGVVESVWKLRNGDEKSAEISPILMAEFGSGWLAEVLFENAPLSQVGQGTFPDQTHAFDPGGWSWMDTDGNWHHSVGFKPSHPMYKAEMEMLKRVYDIAEEVFANGI